MLTVARRLALLALAPDSTAAWPDFRFASTNADSDLLTGLPPILDAEVEVVVLGSFPSPASLAAQQYYAHPQNQFWRLMGELLGEPLAGLPYAERCAVLLRHRVGVWDVYRHCRREGALDAAIEDPELNDFAALRRAAPRLR